MNFHEPRLRARERATSRPSSTKAAWREPFEGISRTMPAELQYSRRVRDTCAEIPCSGGALETFESGIISAVNQRARAAGRLHRQRPEPARIANLSPLAL